MKIFLAGPFHSKEDETRLEQTYDLLTQKGYSVWWAPKKVQRGYESDNEELLKEINETEEHEIEESDILITIMKRASFGTAMEIKHAFDHHIPVISYLLSEHPDFSSGSFKYRVREIVRTDEELLSAIEKYC